MKKTITFLAVVLLTASIWAQSPQKMSYQAVIRNASNTLVTNTAVGMQISILQTTSTGTAVYVETQTPTTNANGLVSIEIGGGTVVSGTFSAIDWSAGPYFIKTETDPAGGTSYTITGTSQLLSVPYALSAGNVTGLEKITEGGYTGWRLKGAIADDYGNIGPNAVDLSISTIASSTTNGATNSYSLATGVNTIASGYISTAMGNGSQSTADSATSMGDYSVASGNYSTAMGKSTAASGNSSTAMGENTKATGNSSTVMGFNATASGVTSFAVGTWVRAQALESVAMGGYNIGGGNPTTWVATDPIFEIGNGKSGSYSNALTVLKNGTITAPSLTNTLITTAGAKALITKEYADANLTVLKNITEGGHTGWRLYWQYPLRYGDIGVGAIDLSYSNLSSSSTLGATGQYSTAMGAVTTASGDYSTAMGVYTKAEAYGSTAIGISNIGGGHPTSSTSVSTDPLFEIGNGTNIIQSNAFTVYKNGNTDVSSILRASGNTWQTTGYGVELAYNASLGIGYIQSVDRDTSPDTFKDLAVGALNLRPVSDNFTSLGTSSRRWTVVYAANGTVQTSDRRLKKEIKNLNYGLNTVMKLRPVSYKWKQGNQDVNLGLIAQEVQKLLPEVVDVGTDKAKTLGMKYTELIPVLIKATQEQQLIIEKQQKEIVALKKMVTKLLKRQIIASN